MAGKVPMAWCFARQTSHSVSARTTGPGQDNPDAAAAASLIAQSAVLIDDQLAAMSANQRSSDGSDAGMALVGVKCGCGDDGGSAAHVPLYFMLQWRQHWVTLTGPVPTKSRVSDCTRMTMDMRQVCLGQATEALTRSAGVRAPSGGAWPAGQWAAQRQAEARGGLEYLLTVGAPAGVIMLFALVAFALGRQVRSA